ncbi:MAG: hypothetical protein ABEJ99_03180 [Candidatus Nanohaloarchaea archaeon]
MELRNSPGDKNVLSVSQVSKHFIPDWATGTKKDRSQGTQQHQEIEDEAEEISEEEMWRRIEDEGGFPEWFVRTEYPYRDNVVLSGLIDFAYFQNGKPELIIERKYPREKNLDTVYQSEKVQAWTYSFMLDQAGFQTDNLDYVIVKLPRGTPKERAIELDKVLVQASVQGDLQDRLAGLKDEAPFNLHGRSYSPSHRLQDVKEAVENVV